MKLKNLMEAILFLSLLGSEASTLKTTLHLELKGSTAPRHITTVMESEF